GSAGNPELVVVKHCLVCFVVESVKPVGISSQQFRHVSSCYMPSNGRESFHSDAAPVCSCTPP
ncbi:hypothetical protein COCVIDRAFT_93133, partial [Bipolaris victoriae FI3]